jgi:hypothetical protein
MGRIEGKEVRRWEGRKKRDKEWERLAERDNERGRMSKV